MMKTGHIDKDRKIIVRNKENVKFKDRNKERFKIKFTNQPKKRKQGKPKIKFERKKEKIKTGKVSEKNIIDVTDKEIETNKTDKGYLVSINSPEKFKPKAKIKLKRGETEKKEKPKAEKKYLPWDEKKLWPKKNMEIEKHPTKLQLKFKPPEKKEKKKPKEKPEQGVKQGKLGYAQPILMPETEKIIKEERKKRKEYKKISVPDIENVETEELEKPEQELKFTNIKYPLIPQNPNKGEKVYAYAHIFWNTKNNELIYKIIEPELNKEDKNKLKKIKEYIQEKIDVSFTAVRGKEALKYLENIFGEALKYFGWESISKKDVYKYYINRDFIGLGKVEPLSKDKNIEDISCDGTNIPIYIYHRKPAFGSIKTNLSFTSNEELDTFVTKLAERCGKSISLAKPLANGTLPDGSRVQATLSSDIARQGSNFTIRKFTEKPLTPTDLLKNKTIDVKTLAYLWMAVENGSSILISGGTATGKTTLLNVLSLFIKPQMKIVSIEDTAELRLPHAHWIPEVARIPIEAAKEVDMFTLLKESLRQRPDYIIVGEVRGREAFVLFQQVAIGHPGLSTIHSEDFHQLMNRLTTKPISLPPNLISSLDLIVFLKTIREEDKYFRKIQSVLEVLDFDKQSNEAVVNDVFKRNSKEDKIDITNDSVLLQKFSDLTGKNKSEVKNDLKERGKVIKWMAKRNVRDYRTVGKIINTYYTNREGLLSKIEAEL